MNRRLTSTLLILGLAAAQLAPAQSTASKPGNPVHFTRDTQEVLGLFEGHVDLIGDYFGPLDFQRGLLNLTQGKSITVRVLTNAATAPNMKPLKAAGARVGVLPADFSRGAAGLMIVHGKAVVYPLKSGGYNVIRDVKVVQGIAQSMEPYWRVASSY